MFQFPQLTFQLIPLSLCLRQKTAAVVAAFVLQILQGLLEFITGAAFITGGDQVIQPPAECLVLSNRQISKLQESRTGENTALYAQKDSPAVAAVQLRNFQTGGSFIGGKFTENESTSGIALNGNIPAVPV